MAIFYTEEKKRPSSIHANIHPSRHPHTPSMETRNPNSNLHPLNNALKRKHNPRRTPRPPTNYLELELPTSDSSCMLVFLELTLPTSDSRCTLVLLELDFLALKHKLFHVVSTHQSTNKLGERLTTRPSSTVSTNSRSSSSPPAPSAAPTSHPRHSPGPAPHTLAAGTRSTLAY